MQRTTSGYCDKMAFVITGHTSGLGYCLASVLRKFGEVYCIGRNEVEFAGDSSNHFAIKQFIIDFKSEQKLQAELYERLFESIPNNEDIFLIINAAIFSSDEEFFPSNDMLDLFNVNFFSAANLLDRAQKYNLRRVLFINSISGLIAQPNQHYYSASKHALHALSSSLAIKAKDSDFDVMSINPGGIKSSLWEKYEHSVDTSDFIELEDLKNLIISLLQIKGRCFIKNLTILPPSDV